MPHVRYIGTVHGTYQGPHVPNRIKRGETCEVTAEGLLYLKQTFPQDFVHVEAEEAAKKVTEEATKKAEAERLAAEKKAAAEKAAAEKAAKNKPETPPA